MESWQVSYIQKNLDFLIHNTICNTSFLAVLQRDILCEEDVSKLEAKRDRDGRFAQTKLLYEMITTRTGAYSVLVEALRETSQTGSLHRLKQARADGTNMVFELKDINELTRWEELDDKLKTEIGQNKVQFQGKYIKLQQLAEYCGLESLDGKILVELAKGEVPCIVNTQVPDKLEYYIQRKVKRRTKLSSKVFQSNIKDVFLVEGIEKHKLSGLVPSHETTEVSGNQLSKLSSRFILLECEEDFEAICKLTIVPVHRVRCVDDVFELVESHGSVESLQNYVSESQDSVFEDELASSNNRVYVISDSPGMGKTSLLANIAHEMLKLDPMRIVRFIVLKELLQAVIKMEIAIDSIVRLIAEQSSEYEFGRKLVQLALKTKPCLLMFDGFDEVLSDQVPIAKKILQEISSLKSARIFVTTRPHYRAELEKTFHVLGYTIQPFDKENQTNFLINFWKMNGVTLNESLSQFADACLEQLTSKMTDFEREIAGIPLQCRLIAETYEEQARRCSKIGFEAYQNSHSAIIVNSMFDMYKKHMDMRFHKIATNESFIAHIYKWFSNSKSQYDAVKHAHMYYALELLFPNHVDQFSSLKTSPISLSDLCGHGLLETTGSDNIRFVHRTFAEYLVAWYVEELEESGVSRQFITSTILKTTPNIVKVIDLRLPSYQFTFPVICYFLNWLTENGKKEPSPLSIINSNVHEQVVPIFNACAFHNYAYIPYFVVALFENHSTQDILNKNVAERLHNILFVAALNSGVELMKFLCENVDIKNVTRQSRSIIGSGWFSLTPIHVAVYRGKYHLVEYLVKKFEQELLNVRFLFHFCVYKSLEEDKTIINDKIQIIKLLMKKSKQWLDELYREDNATPLLRPQVHPEMIKCLIEVGANVNVCDDEQKTVLHKITENPVTPEAYHRVVDALNKRGFQHFNKCNSKHLTPLHCAVKKVELLEETLDLFQSAGITFNEVDESGDSILFYAIRGGRSVRLIQALINRGADWKRCNGKRECVLHICAKHGNYDALEYFVETRKMDINSETNDGFTPLHLAVTEYSENYEKIQSLLITKGADVNARAFNKTPFLEAFLYNGLSLSIIQLIEKHGLEITPLVASQALKNHLLVKATNMFYHQNWEQTLTYLIEKHATLDFEFTSNIWKWEGMKQHLADITSHTEITPELLTDARTRKLLTPHQTEDIRRLPSNKLKRERFYKIIQENEGSVETLYMLLVANKQFGAVRHLKECFELAGDKLRSSMFVTQPPGVAQFIQSQDKLMVLLTKNCELSVRRIHATVDENMPVIHDVRDIDGFDVVVLKCREMTQTRVKEVMTSKTKFICLCNQFDGEIGDFQVEAETYEWNDISGYLSDKIWFRIHGNVYNVMELFENPTIIEAIGANKIKQFEQNIVFKLVDFKIGHPVNQDKSKCLSAEMFNFFIPDKLVFLNIHVDELRALAPYGHKIGSFGEDSGALDYVLIQQSDQFDEIFTNPNTNLHLIEHYEGSFTLLYTKGSDDNIRKFYEKGELCNDFPHCDCAVDNLVVNLSMSVDGNQQENMFVRDVNISLSNVTPKMRRLLRICNSIEVCELMRLIQRMSVPTKPFVKQIELEELKRKSCDEQILQLLEYVLQYLENSSDFNVLTQVAVNTLFPNLAKSSSIGLENVGLGLIEQINKQSSFRIHETLACNLVVELLMKNKPVEDVCINEITKACFTDCSESHKQTVSYTGWYNSEFCSKPIKSFQFVNRRFFQFLNSFASQQFDVICNLIAQYVTTENSCNWAHSIVNDNLGELFKVLLTLVKHEEVFKSEDLALLAVMNANPSVIQLVAEEYQKQTKVDFKNIKIEFRNNTNGYSYTISLLHVAALRGDYSVFLHLFEHHDFKSTFNEPIRNILCFCICDTRTKNLDARKRIIDCILETEPNLLKEASSCLLVPNIHVDLIIHLIHLGVDVNATDDEDENVLHVSSRYMTPIEYDKLVQALHQRGETGILNATNEWKEIPLTVAVKYLELLDSTINVFSSAGVNFNVVNQWNNTVLMHAAFHHRSARVLQSLIQSGSDVNKKGLFNQTVLHVAAEKGDLSALKYFLCRGSDVNAIDESGCTPLQLAIKISEPPKLEIVRSLVEYGADVNAVNNFLRNPLHAALERSNTNGIDSSIIKFLKEHVAERYPSIKDLQRALENWHRETITTVAKMIKQDNFDLLPQSLDSGAPFFQEKELLDVRNIAMGPDAHQKLLSALKKTNQTEAYEYAMRKILQWNTRLMNMIANQIGYWKYDVIEHIVEKIPGFLNVTDDKGRTLLHLSLAFQGEKQFQLIQMLIEHNADVNARDYEALTPLHHAVKQEPVSVRVIEIIKLLIENGADPDAVDERGRTFVHWAPYYFTPELYHELIVYFESTGRNSSLTMVDSHNYTHLHCAVENFEPFVETLKIFKSLGIDFNGKDNDGDSVVLNAIYVGRTAEFLNTLFTFGADWTISNKNQENALHLAARHGNLSALKLFISLKCDVNSPNINGHTPLHTAFIRKMYGEDTTVTNHEVMEELLKNGADVNIRDYNGNLPIDLANERLKMLMVEDRTIELLKTFQM